ncbi:MAG: tetratricopeptide repeat protein, partial [Desulfovibrionaceae bacterium]|nr:tetratricopeptide repeat protein [Desulfovibrionaceae bacterium]
MHRELTTSLHAAAGRAFRAGILMAVICLPGGCAAPKAMPINWDLTPDAELNYSVLALDQSMRGNDVESACDAAEQLIKLDPQNQMLPEAAAWLMLIHENSAAAKLLKKATAKAPDSIPLHLLLAENFYYQGQADAALALLNDFIRLHPAAGQARQEMAILLLKMQRWQDADNAFAKLPEELKTPEMRLNHAQVLTKLKRHHEAVRQMRAAAQSAPHNADIQAGLIEALSAAGDIAGAHDAGKRFLQQSPDNAALRLRLMNIELQQGRAAAAKSMAMDAPKDSAFTIAAASLFLDYRHFEEADALLATLPGPPPPEDALIPLAVLDAELRHDPDMALRRLDALPPSNEQAAKAMMLRVHILSSAERWEETRETLEKACTLFPNDRQFPSILSHYHLLRSDTGKALDIANAYLDKHPDDEEFLFLKGSILDRAGERGKALEIMERIISLNPNTYRALNYVGFFLADQEVPLLAPEKRGEVILRALSLLQRVVSLAPDQAYILDSLAWAQYQAGDIQSAWQNIQR